MLASFVHAQRVARLKHFAAEITGELALEVVDFKVLLHVSNHDGHFATNEAANTTVMFFRILRKILFKKVRFST